jgi:hypothetical protein
MKTYTERPTSKNKMAQKAWDYFVKNRGKPRHMFYSRDHEDGQQWVAYYGINTVLGSTCSSFSEVTSNELENL